MKTYVQASMKSQQNSTRQSNITLTATTLFLLFFFVYVFLPWVSTPNSAGLTLGGYDLAEWASLHPEVRAENPALLTSFTLRLQPVLAVWIFTMFASMLSIRQSGWWLIAFIAFVSSVALLPPLEFFTQEWARNDNNYQQQAFLTIIAMLGGVIGLSGVIWRWLLRIQFILITIAIIGIGTGLYNISSLLREFHIATSIGPGPWISIILLIIMFGYAVLLKPYKNLDKYKEGSTPN